MHGAIINKTTEALGGIARSALALAVSASVVLAFSSAALADPGQIQKKCAEKHFWSKKNRQECVEAESAALKRLNRPINPRIKAYCYDEVGGTYQEIEQCISEIESFRR